MCRDHETWQVPTAPAKVLNRVAADAPQTSMVAVQLTATLRGTLDDLRLIAFEDVDASTAAAAAQALTKAAVAKRVPLLASADGVICRPAAVKSARLLLRPIAVHAASHDRPLTTADVPLLQAALAEWLTGCLVRNGSFVPIERDGALLLDGAALSSDACDADALGIFEDAAAVRIVAVELDPPPTAANAAAPPPSALNLFGGGGGSSSDFDLFADEQSAPPPSPQLLTGDKHGVRVSIRIEGRSVRKGTRGFRPLSVLCDQARAQLASRGIVDLRSNQLWRVYDPEAEGGRLAIARLLPDLSCVRLLSVHATPPTTDEHSAYGARTPAAFQQLWGERFGIWLSDEQAAGPYATVLSEDSAWLTVPTAVLWPHAGMREIHQPAALKAAWSAARGRIASILAFHAPLDGLQLSIEPQADEHDAPIF